MSREEQRDLRSKRDARYLHKNATKPPEQSQSIENQSDGQEKTQLCFDHLIGRCATNSQCGRLHQMRHPRFFGVCKYYISGVCANGDSCQFMHEDYPCRFFHMDLDHPKNLDKNNCRFKHGGPLPERLLRYFKKQIEIWVKTNYKDKPEQIDNMLMTFLHKFEMKQAKLQQEHNAEVMHSSAEVSNDGGFFIGTILTSKQIKKLTEKNITTAAQINQIPIDDLLEYGLTMDQIYKITTNITIGGSQSQMICDDLMDIDTNDEDMPVLNKSTEIDAKDFISGFSDVEIEEAKEKIQITQFMLQTVAPINENPTVINETETLDRTIIETVDANNQKSNNNNKNNGSNSDSDDEFSLIINEDEDIQLEMEC